MASEIDTGRMTQMLDGERMRDLLNIKPVSDMFRGNRIDLPNGSGVYVFWWTAERSKLLAADRLIEIGGPNNRYERVEYGDWWPSKLPPCLYVGKSTNIKKRLPLHIKRGTERRLHPIRTSHKKQTPCTTSCQLRFGIEHVFRTDSKPLAIILNSVGYSYSVFPPNSLAERFFLEDWLIGNWRPWFNIDSER